MAHGGARPGAGRKPGAINKMSREAREKAQASGITPLDYMLSLLRDENAPRDVRLDAAKSAAPYVHPRLSSIEANVAVSSHESFIDELDAAADAVAGATSAGEAED